MSRGLKALIMIGIGVLAIMLIIVFGLKRPGGTGGQGALISDKGKFSGAVQPAPAPEGSSAEEIEAPPPPPEPTTPEAQSRISAELLARTFAERYGSYSNQGNYENLRDVYPLITVAFRSRLEAQAAATPAAADYSGVTTRALVATADSFDDTAGTAVVSVRTQRVTTTAAGSKNSYETVVLVFVKQNGSWKIDRATWQ